MKTGCDDDGPVVAWHVLVCGLELSEPSFDLGPSLILRRLHEPLTVFDMAAVGAVGFREWAVLEPLLPAARAEIVSAIDGTTLPGYDALNKAWLGSSLLVLRGYARHLCVAVSGYSWSLVAAHRKSASSSFRRQMVEEGVDKAVFEPRAKLPPFRGQLLDYHLNLLLPKETRSEPVGAVEAQWVADHFEIFNGLASEDERFRFALEAAIDWRYSRDPRAAMARVWAGIESLFAITSELVYRIALYAAIVVAPRGPERLAAFKRVKALYALRSKAVHGDPITEERLLGGLHESFELIRSLLLDAVERGRVRADEDYQSELLE